MKSIAAQETAEKPRIRAIIALAQYMSSCINRKYDIIEEIMNSCTLYGWPLRKSCLQDLLFYWQKEFIIRKIVSLSF